MSKNFSRKSTTRVFPQLFIIYLKKISYFNNCFENFDLCLHQLFTAVKIVCGSIFRFLLAINTQCAVIDMQIILNDILHDLWIHMTVSSGPKSGFFFVGTLNCIMAIAQKIGHLEDWNRCHLHQLDLWIFSQKSFCPQTPW